MIRMKRTVAIGSMLVMALVVGCLSAKQKAMDVELQLLQTKLDGEAAAEDVNVKMSVNISAKNMGDPGKVTFVVKMLDDEGKTLATKEEAFHLDSGEARVVTVVVEKVLPADFDWEVVYPAISSPTTEPD